MNAAPESNPKILNPNGQAACRLFVGNEVEFTPFYGDKTLFVQGLVPHEAVIQAIKKLVAQDDPVTNVYLGAGGLSQADPDLIPLILAEGLTVTVETVAGPEVASTFLKDRAVVLVVPVSNEGRPQAGAADALCNWYSAMTADRSFYLFYHTQVFLKIDTADPSVLIFPVALAGGLTRKEAYTNDVTLPIDF